jgi:outer membrane protein assembly factor BamB
VDTQDSNFDTVLAVYQGNTLSTLVEVASNDDTEHAAFKWKSRLNFNATAGTTYSIAVDGFFYPLDNLTTSGIVRLRLQQNRPPTVVASVFYAQEAVPTSLALSANDPDGQELRFVITQTPLHGRAGTPNGIDGAFTYTSEPGFRGQDSFQVIATDGVENSLPTLVTINVVATVDTDNDGLPDAWETASSLRLGVNDAHEDPDSDGLTNLQEYLGGADPKNAASGPMKISNELIRPAFTPNANWGTSSGGNSVRNSLSSQVGPTTVPTQLWSGGSFANFGSSTFVEGGIVITTRFNPSDPNNRTSRQNGGWIQALSLETGALLWQKQLPIDLPATDDTSYAVGVNKGRVYATRGADGSSISFLYALDLATGNILWRSEEACFAEGFYDQSPVYTSEGDLIFSFQLKSYRINHLDGRTVWKSQNFNESYSCEAIYGNRLYGRYNKRNRAVLAAFDIETGAFLYQGDFFPAGFGVASGNPQIFISPEGTICLPVSANNPKLDYLYAFEDTGTGFRFKWQSPLPFVFLTNFGAGPDDSIYSFSRDKRIVRLRSRDGQIMHSSPVFSNMNLVSRMAVDASGAVFLSDGAGQLYSLNPDLTLRWQLQIANIGIGGPLLAENGTLVVARDGVGGVQAYRQLPLGIPGRGRSPMIMQTATPLLFHSKVTITFTGKVLEQAESPAGPWTKIMGASSPWTIPVEQTRKFFRARLY